MARKNIFDIAKENNSIEKDIVRIIDLVFAEKTIRISYVSCDDDYTLFDYVSKYLFKKWKQRGHCSDLKDFANSIDLEEEFHKTTRPDSLLSILLCLEFVYNLWYLADADDSKKLPNFKLIKTIMDDTLAALNYKPYYEKDNEKLIVIENNPATTAVAEIVDDDLALDLIRYNHYALKGDLKEKQRILKIMADALEARKDEIKSIDNSFYSDISFLLNNINIRHNNTDKKSKNYKKVVADMRDIELEEWYDETYQMILLAFLRLDNVKRARKVTELKRKINGE